MKKLYYIILTSVFTLGCGNNSKSIDPIPNHDSFKIESKHVNETRIINVWTPPVYEKGIDSLTVIYMPDGGVKEDFPHIANTIAKLVEEKSIPPIILVGIENTDRRRDLTGVSDVKEDEEYCPLTDGASNFRNFITEELFEEINKRYRTKANKGIIGESLSGLFVMETFMIKPKSFNYYIAMDPSLWWNNHFLVRNANDFFDKLPNNEIKLWFAGSSAEDILQYTNELDKLLQSNSPNNLIWKYSDEPNEKHNTIFRATKEKALKWMLKKQ